MYEISQQRNIKESLEVCIQVKYISKTFSCHLIHQLNQRAGYQVKTKLNTLVFYSPSRGTITETILEITALMGLH